MEFGAWEIWNGGTVPAVGLVQVQTAAMSRIEAEAGKPRRADGLDWALTTGPRAITAFRRLSGPYVVALFGHQNSTGQWLFTEGRADNDTHRIRFRMVGGEPDVTTVDMVAG